MMSDFPPFQRKVHCIMRMALRTHLGAARREKKVKGNGLEDRLDEEKATGNVERVEHPMR